MTDYQNRQNWDLDAWPEMYGVLKQLQGLVFTSPPGRELNMMVFTVSSLAAGCRHCQAHGAYAANRGGVPTEKVTALWSFESSDLFDDRERAALRFGLAAGSVPNGVRAEHHADLRDHFSDAEVRTLIAVVGVGGFMNRYNDALATVTDQESVDWAMAHLAPVGWEVGKHTGAAHEQRIGPPGRR